MTQPDANTIKNGTQVWRIKATSCSCGGRWAWFRRRPSGAWESQGCVCHHPFTLMMRLIP